MTEKNVKSKKGYPYNSSSKVNGWIFVLSVYLVNNNNNKKKNHYLFYDDCFGCYNTFSPTFIYIVVSR